MSSPDPFRILSRGSPLARLQVDEALPALRRALPDADFTHDVVETIGDRDQHTALTDAAVPTDFFTRDLDRAQIDGHADLVIHSAKDLPDPMPDGLVVAAMLPARDTRDVLILRPGESLDSVRVVGTSSPVREAHMRTRFPDAECKPIRGGIGRRIEQIDDGSYDALVTAGCAMQRLGWDDRITEWLDYETTPLQGRLAITVRADRRDLIDALAAIDVRRAAGLVALVGCPADARLLGGQALDLIDAADIVLHDRLIPAEILDRLGERGEYVGKKGHSHSTTQAHIHRRILHGAESGRLVVRLHGGEPGVLGHLGETLDYCHAWQLRTEVVPAVSAAQLAAARARCSLTHRHDGRSITFLSGHKALADHAPAALSPEHGHLAIYMGVRDAAAIRDRLFAAGWPPDAPVTVGQNLGTPDEDLLSTSLHSLPEADLRSPAVFLVGPRPHEQPYTLFTGTTPSKFLRQGPLLHFPMIELAPRPLAERVRILRDKLPDWDGLILPSGPAVRHLMEAVMEMGDVRLLHGKRLLAVGPHTANALRAHGLRADAAPDGFGGAAALADLPGLKPGRYGYPTSDQSPVDERRAALAPAGVDLDPVVFHTTRPARPDHLPSRPFNRVLFTSGSTVRAYFDAFPEEKHADRDWLAVGTSTQRALREAELPARIL